MKKLLILTIFLTGCSSCLDSHDIVDVKCKGWVEFKTMPNRRDNVWITKFDRTDNKVYSSGRSRLGMQGWLPPDSFDKIVCDEWSAQILKSK